MYVSFVYYMQFSTEIGSDLKNSVPLFSPFYTIGAVLGTVRSCLCADKIASRVTAMVFNIDQLTEHVFGFSDCDSTLFLPHYVVSGILPVLYYM